MSPPVTPRGNSASQRVAPEPQNASTGQMPTASGTVVPVTHLPPNSGPQRKDFVPNPSPPPPPIPLTQRRVSTTDARVPSPPSGLSLSPTPLGPLPGSSEQSNALLSDSALPLLSIGVQPSSLSGPPSNPSPSPLPAEEINVPLSERALKLLLGESSEIGVDVLRTLARTQPETVREIFDKFVEADPEKAATFLPNLDHVAPHLFAELSEPHSRPSEPRGRAVEAALQLFDPIFPRIMRNYFENHSQEDIQQVIAQFEKEHFRPFFIKPLSVDGVQDIGLREVSRYYLTNGLLDRPLDPNDPELLGKTMDRALGSVSLHGREWLRDIAIITDNLDSLIEHLKDTFDESFDVRKYKAALIRVASSIFATGFTAHINEDLRAPVALRTAEHVLTFLQEVDRLDLRPPQDTTLHSYEDLLLEAFNQQLTPSFAAAKQLIDGALPNGFPPLAFATACFPNEFWGTLRKYVKEGALLGAPEDMLKEPITNAALQRLQDAEPPSLSNQPTPEEAAIYCMTQEILRAFQIYSLDATQTNGLFASASKLAERVVEIDIQARGQPTIDPSAG